MKYILYMELTLRHGDYLLYLVNCDIVWERTSYALTVLPWRLYYSERWCYPERLYYYQPLHPLFEGDAAALSSRSTVLGLGGDIGGSLRIPSAWCGVAALKPTAGRLSFKYFVSSSIGQTISKYKLICTAIESVIYRVKTIQLSHHTVCVYHWPQIYRCPNRVCVRQCVCACMYALASVHVRLCLWVYALASVRVYLCMCALASVHVRLFMRACASVLVHLCLCVSVYIDYIKCL